MKAKCCKNREAGPRRVAAIYVRTAVTSPEAVHEQLTTCKQWAAENNFVVPEEMIFSDDGVSGRGRNAPGFEALKQAVESHEIDVVVFASLSQLGRIMAKAAAFVEETLRPNQVRGVFLSPLIDTDDERWEVLQAICSITCETQLEWSKRRNAMRRRV